MQSLTKFLFLGLGLVLVTLAACQVSIRSSLPVREAITDAATPALPTPLSATPLSATPLSATPLSTTVAAATAALPPTEAVAAGAVEDVATDNNSVVASASLAQMAELAAHTTVVLDGLTGPVGLAALADGSLLIAEEGTGEDDASAGITVLTPQGERGRLISGLPSSRDAGDLAGAHLVSVAPDGTTIYVGSFGTGHLWQYSVELPLVIPDEPLLPHQLEQAMMPLNNVYLVNPFAMTYAADGRPIVSDASGNGVATTNSDGTTRFIHRFDMLPNPLRASDPIEAVPAGIERVGAEYYVALFGGCPYPEHSGQIVAINEQRNQRTVVGGLNLPIDVAQGADGTIWVLEFAHFTPGASCFDGSGYQPRTGRLSRLRADGQLQTVIDNLDFPGALLPMADGTLYYTEAFAGRVLHVRFGDTTEPIAQHGEALPESMTTVPMTTSLTASVTATTPITSIVNGPQGLRFIDITTAVGVDFQHGAFRNTVSMDPIAAMGAGLCWIDFDNDGWLDLYLVNSHAVDEEAYWAANGGLPRNALYHNQHGTFVDVGVATGVDVAIRGNGCVAADLNLDGFQDLFITADGPDLLFWNQGNGTFVEGALTAGVAAPEWNSAAVVGDLNRDGLPDLFVAAYIDLAKMIPKPSGAFPQDFYGLPDRLYLNQGIDPGTGHATFREVTGPAGLTREERGLGALLTDVDRDGDLDLYIANDGHPNRLYTNTPWPGGILADPAGIGFRFEDMTALADVGDSGSGMGVAGGDYNGDAQIDLLITNWDRELNALYANLTADGAPFAFQYETFRMGMSGFGAGLTGWGVQMADFDHDRDDDLLIVNGHVPITDFAVDAEPIRFYRNRYEELARSNSTVAGPPRRFADESELVGLAAVGPLMARGSATADFDNDGDLDVAINTVGGRAVLLANNAADDALGNWLEITVAGFQPGMRVRITLPDGGQLLRETHVGSSYLAGEDPRLHIGLGDVAVVPRIDLRWPDGTTRVLEQITANQILSVVR